LSVPVALFHPVALFRTIALGSMGGYVTIDSMAAVQNEDDSTISPPE
jgi:hypothetical protein